MLNKKIHDKNGLHTQLQQIFEHQEYVNNTNLICTISKISLMLKNDGKDNEEIERVNSFFFSEYALSTSYKEFKTSRIRKLKSHLTFIAENIEAINYLSNKLNFTVADLKLIKAIIELDSFFQDFDINCKNIKGFRVLFFNINLISFIKLIGEKVTIDQILDITEKFLFFYISSIYFLIIEDSQHQNFITYISRVFSQLEDLNISNIEFNYNIAADFAYASEFLLPKKDVLKTTVDSINKITFSNKASDIFLIIQGLPDRTLSTSLSILGYNQIQNLYKIQHLQELADKNKSIVGKNKSILNKLITIKPNQDEDFISDSIFIDFASLIREQEIAGVKNKRRNLISLLYTVFSSNNINLIALEQELQGIVSDAFLKAELETVKSYMDLFKQFVKKENS